MKGWVLFAGVMLAILGTLNLIDGIAAVGNSSFFVGEAKFVLGDLNTWGWVMIAVGVTQLLVAVGVWGRVKGVRWLGVAIAALERRRAAAVHRRVPVGVGDAVHARHPRDLRARRPRRTPGALTAGACRPTCGRHTGGGSVAGAGLHALAVAVVQAALEGERLAGLARCRRPGGRPASDG